MEDFIKSIKAYLYERVSSPLFSAFIISWLVWNIRVVMIVFSDLDVFTKLYQVELYFQSTHPVLEYYQLTIFSLNQGYLFNSLIIPLIIALIYILISPVLSIPVYLFSLKIQSKMLEIKKKSDSQTVLTPADRARIYSDLAKAEEKMEQELERSNRKIRALNEELELLRENASSIDEADSADTNEGLNNVREIITNIHGSKKSTEVHDDIEQSLTEQEEEILEYFYRMGEERVFINEIVSSSSNLNNIHIVKNALNHLEELGYVNISADNQWVRTRPDANKYIAEHFATGL